MQDSSGDAKKQSRRARSSGKPSAKFLSGAKELARAIFRDADRKRRRKPKRSSDS